MLISFKFRWVPFIATVLVATIGIALGQWQTRRAQEKEAIEMKLATRESAPPVILSAKPLAADALEHRHVIIKGEFIPNWPVYLENRPYKGAAGFYVLMPMKITGSGIYVLIARGWIPRNITDRAKLPSLLTPNGLTEVAGVVRLRLGHVMQLGHADALHPGAIMQNVEIAEFEAASKLPMLPFIVEQSSDMRDGLVRDWPRPSSGHEKHRGYVFQWFGLAAMAILFFVVTGFRRGTK